MANPSVVDLNADDGDTSKGNARHSFRNPRGNQRYYSFYRDRITFEVAVEWSLDGETWTNTPQTVTSTGANIYSFDVHYHDDGTQLVVFLAYHRLNEVHYIRGTLADTSNTIVWGTDRTADGSVSGEPAFASITRTFNGNIVILYAQGQGLYRETWLAGGDDDSDNPVWTLQRFDDPSGDTDNQNKGDVWGQVYAFSSAFPNRVLVVVKLPNGISVTAYKVTSGVPEWNGTTWSNLTQNDIITTDQATNGAVLSCVVDSGDIAHAIYYDPAGTELESVKGGTAGEDDFGSPTQIKANAVDACSLTIDQYDVPDMLFAFYHDTVDSTNFHYKTSPVDTISWGTEQTVTFSGDIVQLNTGKRNELGTLYVGHFETTDANYYYQSATAAGPLEIDINASLLLAKGNNRAAFRNPRGNKRYYVVYYDTSAVELRYAWSVNGEDWVKNITIDAGVKECFDLKIRDDGAQLRIYLVYHEGSNIYYRRGSVADSADTITWAAENTVKSSVGNNLSGPHCAAIARTDNGRLVVAFTEDRFDSPNYDRDTDLIGSNNDGDTPTWSGETQWDEGWASSDQSWFGLDNFSSSYPNRVLICGRFPGAVSNGNFVGTSAVPDWNGTTFSNTTPQDLGTLNIDMCKVVSCLVDGSDMTHVLYYRASGVELHHRKGQTAGADDWAATAQVDSTDADACSLSIDKQASPNKLYAFYHDVGDSENFNYKTSPADTISWSSEQSITYGQDVIVLSASLRDYVNSIHIAGVFS